MLYGVVTVFVEASLRVMVTNCVPVVMVCGMTIAFHLELTAFAVMVASLPAVVVHEPKEPDAGAVKVPLRQVFINWMPVTVRESPAVSLLTMKTIFETWWSNWRR